MSDVQTDGEKLAELESLFDLMWAADMRGIKRWQEATGRTLTWPDRADLVVWLLEQLAEAEAKINVAAARWRIPSAVVDGASSVKIPDYQKPKDCNRQYCEWPHCRDHVGVCAFTANRRAIDG